MTPYVENGDPAPLWRLLRSAVGSYAYCAPEILTKNCSLERQSWTFLQLLHSIHLRLKKKKHDKSPSPSIFVAVQNWAHGVPLLMLIYDGTQMVDIRGRDVFLSVDPDGF